MHAACLFVFAVGTSPVAVLVAAIAYLVACSRSRASITVTSHRSFKTSRVGQFVFGVLGAAAVQRGPLWWAAHHRHHHAWSDRREDAHSPLQHGFLRSHMGWFLSKRGFVPDLKRVRDLLQFPELRWLDRFDIIVPVLLAIGMFALGALLANVAPHLGTNGWQMLVWGFFISTVACYHGTYTINCCRMSSGDSAGDSSRNNWLLALVTLGEGWHNNHHHYPGAVRQGFYWWKSTSPTTC